MKLKIVKLTTFNRIPKGGLFLDGDTLVLKAEYSTANENGTQEDAYIVGSGEYYWGGTSDVRVRAKLKVLHVRFKI